MPLHPHTRSTLHSDTHIQRENILREKLSQAPVRAGIEAVVGGHCADHRLPHTHTRSRVLLVLLVLPAFPWLGRSLVIPHEAYSCSVHPYKLHSSSIHTGWNGCGLVGRGCWIGLMGLLGLPEQPWAQQWRQE